MEDGDAPLYLHLQKIPATTTEETLAQVLETLWGTRSKGLGPNHRPALQSLLDLPTLQELDPVLASLRSIIRKTVRQNLSGDDIQKLFPPDLPAEVRRILSVLLHRYRGEWKEEASRDQPLWQHTRVSQQPQVNMPTAFAPFPTSELSSSVWSRKDDTTYNYNGCSNSPTPTGDTSFPCVASVPICRGSGSLTNELIHPHLKSMTWRMENQNSAPANRVAVICLKLQDYAKSALGEVEVKFQLSRDTLEAMLRSMTYISEQLSNSVPASEPSTKKQRQ